MKRTWEEQNDIDRALYNKIMAAKPNSECRRLTCKEEGFSRATGELLCSEHYNQDCNRMSRDGV